MRFSAVHKVSSYLMAAAAFAALALSRELPTPLVIATAIIGFLSFFAEPSKIPLLRSRGWILGWNLVTLAALLWSTIDALGGALLDAGVRFVCLLLLNKLWNRRTSRDYLQAYVVSFLMLVAGAALSSEMTYAGCFVAYVVFATWTLTLFHLRREMEENYLLKHSDSAQSERVEVERILNSRRIVGGSVLAATSLVSLGVFMLSTVIFFSIPRVGFGFFVSHARRGATTIGFSDRVELGEYGLVKDNPQVVMRVELPSGRPALPLHMRGVSFDRYEHGHWTRSPDMPSDTLRRWSQGYWFVGLDRKQSLPASRAHALLRNTLEQRVYLDPLDTPVLFAAGRPVAFELPSAMTPAPVELETHGDGEVLAVERRVDPTSGRSFAVERRSALRYNVYSDDQGPPVARMAAVPDLAPGDPAFDAMAPYLQLPADMPARVIALAHEITSTHRGPLAKAAAVDDYLQRFRYTLDLKRDARYEPLEDFLFVQKAGHCEYFASAMAVLLRAGGVPTRTVNGFLASEWNDYGHYLAVRQQDAHTWVEVLIGDQWVMFDPTPPSPGNDTSHGWWNRTRQLFDTVQLKWFKYVIEYDLGKQVDAIKAVRSTMSGMSTPQWKWRWRSARPWLIVGVALALIYFAARRWPRRRRKNMRPLRVIERRAQSALERAQAALGKRGLLRGSGETPRALALRATEAADAGAPPFAELVELYYAARFGQRQVSTSELDALAGKVVRPPSAAATDRQAAI